MRDPGVSRSRSRCVTSAVAEQSMAGVRHRLVQTWGGSSLCPTLARSPLRSWPRAGLGSRLSPSARGLPNAGRATSPSCPRVPAGHDVPYAADVGRGSSGVRRRAQPVVRRGPGRRWIRQAHLTVTRCSRADAAGSRFDMIRRSASASTTTATRASAPLSYGVKRVDWRAAAWVHQPKGTSSTRGATAGASMRPRSSPASFAAKRRTQR